MSVLCHIVLFIYAVAFGAVSIVTMGLFARIIPDAQVWNEFLYLCSRWETLGVAIVVFLCSLYLLYQSLSTHSKEASSDEVLIVHGDVGETQISLDALKDMAIKIARSVDGVRDVKLKLKIRKSASNSKLMVPIFKFKIDVAEHESVTIISDAIRNKLQDYLKIYVGIEESSIEIVIATMINSEHHKKRVV